MTIEIGPNLRDALHLLWPLVLFAGAALTGALSLRIASGGRRAPEATDHDLTEH